MSDRELDIDSLTQDQQLALQQFTSVTDQDLVAAIPLLRRCEWNVQIAIARFFDGESAEPALQEQNIPPPNASRRQEVLLSAFSDGSQTSRRIFLQPAPRIVASSGNAFYRSAPVLVSLILHPINLIFAILKRLASLFARIFPFLPNLLSLLGSANRIRPQLSQQSSNVRFLQEFRADYDPSNRLPLTEMSYARAYDTAKRELRFLLVVPLSPEHDLTSSYIKNILLSSEFLAFLSEQGNRVILWAGYTSDSEPYQVADALGATGFPFAALIVHTPSISSTSMSVVTRLEQGSEMNSPSAFIAKLDAAIRHYSNDLQQAQTQRTEQQASRDLRAQQESAYERSLATDRARAQAKRDAEKAKEEAEKAEKDRLVKQNEYASRLQKWRRWRASRMKPEPKNTKEAVRVSLRLLNGSRAIRNFAQDASLEEIYAFAECYDEIMSMQSTTVKEEIKEPRDFTHKYDFHLVSPLPREVFNLEEKQQVPIKQQFGRSANLLVEKIDDFD